MSRIGLMALVLLGATAWTPVGSMTYPRGTHSTTTLPDGRVLVAGGYNTGPWQADDYWNSTEIFDSADGSWHLGPALLEARSHHAAVLLADGRVLVAGGRNNSTNHQTVEIFNPTMNAWTFAAPMSTLAGAYIEATLLADGRVLAVKGNAAEIYDPMADTWSVPESPVEYRCGFRATPLLDGRVLITGGQSQDCIWGGTVLSSATTYDPATGHFVNVGSMMFGRKNHIAVRLADGRVLIAGGLTGMTDTIGASEIFDPATNTFSFVAPMPVAFYDGRGLLLPNGEVLVAGGLLGYGSLTHVARFNPLTGRWSSWYPLLNDRSDHTLALLPTGEVLAAGGYYNYPGLGDAFGFVSAAEISGDLSTPYANAGVVGAGEACSDPAQCASKSCAGGICCETYCPENGCNDCTGKYAPAGICMTQSDGVSCSNQQTVDKCKVWACQSGKCVDNGPVTCAPSPDPSCTVSPGCFPDWGCQYLQFPDGEACQVNGLDGTCLAGICQVLPGTSSSSSGGIAGAGGNGGEGGTAGAGGSAGTGGSAGAGEGGNAGMAGSAGEGGNAGAGGMIGTSSSSSTTGSSSGKPSSAHQQSARPHASCSMTSRSDEVPRRRSFIAGLGLVGLLATLRSRRRFAARANN